MLWNTSGVLAAIPSDIDLYCAREVIATELKSEGIYRRQILVDTYHYKSQI